ncbi:MAG: MBL fold metallo-hydrolase [Candidatus Melainabacteria bacterium]|nr:MBL fold metallo-hydrolase [Candidatus Melainabacteria bacterium]
MKVSSHGAAREVTGSCHLVEAGKTKALIDCGMFQGGLKQLKKNKAPFEFDPSEIDFVILTHAHLDHCGLLPLLVKRGFRGEILTTSASRELAELVMLDSAKINEQNANHKTRKPNTRYSEKKNFQDSEALYTKEDVMSALNYFGRTLAYGEVLKLSKDIEVKPFDAGHIIGSASVVLRLTEGMREKKIVFSGDIGNVDKPLIRDPSFPPKADYVVMETLYGDRLHKPIAESIKEFYTAINQTLKQGGNVVVPIFAMERAQEFLYLLREGVENGILPGNVKIFLDSPMAITATEIFRRHPECFNKEALELLKGGIDPFTFPNFKFTRNVEESKHINDVKSGAVILAGSGMANGGRVYHHLKHNLGRPECAVVIVSFASTGTLARVMIDGAEEVKIFGEDIPVRAKIYTINGFSGHAGRNGLLSWHRHTGNPDTTFLVHGDEKPMQSIADTLRAQGKHIEMPSLHDEYKL